MKKEISSSRTSVFVVLASSSQSRFHLLRRLKLDFSVAAPQVDETPQANETAADLVKRLSCAKAQVVGARYESALIIASDQCAVLGESIFGKPGSVEQSYRQLVQCSGKQVVFHTGLCLLDTRSGDYLYDDVQTRIQYRNFTREQAEIYVELEQPLDCCGSHRSEGLGIALCERIDSADPSALLGLPLITLTRFLEQAGLPLLAGNHSR